MKRLEQPARRRAAWAGIALAAFLCMMPAAGFGQIFLKLSGIQGESQDAHHTNEIEVTGWSWGMASSNSVVIKTTTTSLQAVSLLKRTDRSTPRLMQAACSGALLTNAILSFVSPANALEYYRMELTEVRVTALQATGATSDSYSSERVGLAFATVKMDYVRIQPDGTGAAPVGWFWDIGTNTGGLSGDLLTQTGAFAATMSFTAGTGEATISWKCVPGRSYTVYFAPSLDQPFVTYGTYPAGGAQSLSITVPATKAQEFFRVQEVSQ